MNVEKYLDNELSNAEKIEFEAKLKHDTALQKEVLMQQKLRSTLQQMSLRAKVSQNFQEVKATNTKPFRIAYRIAASILGLCLIVALAYWTTRNNSDNQIVTTPEMNPQNTNITATQNSETQTWRDAETPTPKNQLADAKIKKQNEPESDIRNVKTTNENKSNTLVQNYLKYSKSINYNPKNIKINDTDSISLWKGINALKANQAEDAGRFLMTIKEESALYDAAQWYFVLSLLQRERLETAKNMLHDIENNENQPFKTQASNLLKELN